MPGTARASVGGVCHHVINRGNARAQVFHNGGDYRAFVDLVTAACERLPTGVRIGIEAQRRVGDNIEMHFFAAESL